MTSAMGFPALVLAVVIGVAASVPAATSVLFAARRRRALFRFADQFGLEYTPVDRTGLIDHAFDLFNLADGGKCRNVVSGRWKGVEVQVAELRFAPSWQSTREGRRGSTRQFSFAFTAVQAWLPHLKIRRDAFGTLAEGLGLRRIRFESEQFNRTFDVVCESREFA